MSSDPIGSILGSAAGVPMAQSARLQGAAAQQAARIQQQQRAAQLQADHAAGIAEPDAQEMELQERDADGRQSWRRGDLPAGNSDAAPPDSAPHVATAVRHVLCWRRPDCRETSEKFRWWYRMRPPGTEPRQSGSGGSNGKTLAT